MKKMFLFLLIIFSAATVFAADVTIGPKIGLGASWFSGEDWDDFVDSDNGDNASLTNFSIGVFFDIAVSETFSIQPEINILFTGAFYDGSFVDEDGDRIQYDNYLKFTVIEIPVLFKGKISADPGTFNFFAGPDIFFILGDLKQKIEFNVYYDDYKNDTEPDSRLDFGISLGGGYGFKVGNGILDLSLNYAKSLTGIGSDDKVDLNIVRLNCGYGFSIK